MYDITAFKELAARCAECSSTEQGTSYYDWFPDEESDEARLVEGNASYETIVTHATGPVFTETGPELMTACTIVHMDSHGDTAKMASVPQFWPSTYWGTAVVRLTG